MPAPLRSRCRRLLLLGLCLVAVSVAVPARAATATVEVTDLAGRQVSLPRDAQRVILGEGRLLYALAALQPEEPFASLVGWRDELIRFDKDVWRRLVERFPHAESLTRFGKAATGEFDLELALSLRPEVIVFDLGAWPALRDGPALAALQAAGTAVVFVDFLTQPDRHMEPSLRLLGRVFGTEARAEALIALRRESLDAVASRLPEPRERPRVLLETAAGLHADCCRSVGDDNLGRVVRLAGGHNLAADRLPGLFGQLHPEWVLAQDPDVIIMTGGDWQALRASAVPLGYDIAAAESRGAMRRLVAARPGWSALTAVAAGRVHALWHPFYNSPFQFVAVQRVAKWLHPEAMADLDPEGLWRTIHADHLPYPLEGTFWVDMGAMP